MIIYLHDWCEFARSRDGGWYQGSWLVGCLRALGGFLGWQLCLLLFFFLFELLLFLLFSLVFILLAAFFSHRVSPFLVYYLVR